MKKVYHTPALERYGSVDEITRAFGDRRHSDTIFHSDGRIIGQDAGESRDGIVIPCNDPEAPPCG